MKKIEATVATCTKCNGVVYVGVKEEPFINTVNKEISELAKIGCNINTMSISEARKAKWCGKPCEGMFKKKKRAK